MASGTINGSTSNKYITARIVWSSSTNAAANTSSVTAILQYRRTNSGYTTHGTLSRTININGNSVSSSGSISIGTSWVEAWRRTVTVSHNGDGTKKCWIGASGGISGTSLSSTSCGATVTLDTIPRASGMSLSKTSVATGESFTVNISPHSNSFSHEVKISFHDKTKAYNVSAGTESVNVSLDKNWVTCFTDKRSSWATVTVTTKNGNSSIGSTSKTITVTVPSDVKPTVGTPTFSDTTGAYDVMGAYATGFSQVSVSVPAKVYSGDFTDTATLKSVTATYNGTTYDAKSGGFSFKPTQSGDMTIVAVDSRDTSSDTYTKSITVKPYAKPTVTVDASRCDVNGNADDTGNYAIVTIGTTIDRSSENESENLCYIFTTNYSYNQGSVNAYGKQGYAGVWVVNEITATVKVGDYCLLQVTNEDKNANCWYYGKINRIVGRYQIDVETEKLIDPGQVTSLDGGGFIRFYYRIVGENWPAANATWFTFKKSEKFVYLFPADNTKSYELWADINDGITTIYNTMLLSNGQVPLDFKAGGDGIAIGKTATRPGLDIGWPMMGAGFIKSVVDLIYPVGSIYMSVNPTDPAILFGGTWERLKDHFLLAAGDTYAGGTTGGEADHKLTIDEMPSHQHRPRIYEANSFNGVENSNVVSMSKQSGDNKLSTWAEVNQTPYYGQATGGGKAHNNMPPYLTVYMWERTA